MPVIEYDPSRSALYTPARRPTVFEPGADYSSLQIAVEAARLAYLNAAQAENSAEDHQALVSALACVGMSAPRLFSDEETGTFGFGCRRASDGMALLSFRGTQPEDIGDIVTNLEINTVAWTESSGRVHSGFATAMRSVIPEIQSWLDVDCAGRRELVICGHSLGAALATLAATLWRPDVLVTLGSPRVGNAAFAQSLDNVKIVRMVDCCDAVTRIPPETPWYTHVGTEHYINRAGGMVKSPDEEYVSDDCVHAREAYLAQHAWKSGAVLVRDLADHSPINYVRAVW
ncbi:MAG: lipase family protein [Pseudomonadota bacterium]|nr:lipase family protein [Pseudomonadota bacterium]